MTCPGLRLDSIDGRENVELRNFEAAPCRSVAWWPRAAPDGYRISKGRITVTYGSGRIWSKDDYVALSEHDGDLLYWSP